MANEEQRQAFASYMGTSDASAGQQASPTTGAYANPGNPYLYQVSRVVDSSKELTYFQQFPGIQGLPAAPTPPPAAPSSVASFPSYTGGYLGVHQQSAFPSRPPPLGHSDTLQGQLSGQQPNYYHAQSSYNNQPLQQPGYNTNWQHVDTMARQNGHSNGVPASGGTMVSSPPNFSREIVESRRKHSSEQYHYQEYRQPAPHAEPVPPQVAEQTVPVLLCHTCSVCSRMRSAGYHRNNPVVPGKPLVLTPCRKCKKKMKQEPRSMSSYTRVRSCTAEEPCDWPREPVRVEFEYGERRGRRRSREEVRAYRRSPSRPHVVQQSSSQKFGLRSLQREESMPRVLRNETTVRVSSLSPRRASRYDGIWPPPDVVSMRASQAEVPRPPPSNPNVTSREEVWPPPDAVRTHSYRKVASTPIRRQSSRIIELSPSPPPIRTRLTRVAYRSESVERRPRSVSPVRVNVRDDGRNGDAEARMMAHPRAYRSVVPDRRSFARESEETASSSDYMTRGRQDSPSRSILKSVRGERETSRRRTSMRESQQSTIVEVGGPKVHFSSERRDDANSRGSTRYAHSGKESGEHYRDYARHRYVEAEPPIEEMHRVRIKETSVSPRGRSYDEEIRIDRARGISPCPPTAPQPARRHEDIRSRHVSPRRAVSRERPMYRHVSRPRPRSRSPTPPSLPVMGKAEAEDVTDSDSAHSGEVTEVRSWRGIDENGRPATFVEERRMVKKIEMGSERGGGYGDLDGRRRAVEREGLGSRSWRDV
ncbi:hypothetical protein ACEQ8H_005828 [Pleosporales sp. CAS-2024a]